MPLENNLARNFPMETPAQLPPKTHKTTVHTPSPKKNSKTIIEKWIIGVVSVIAFVLIAVSISLEMTIASANRELQDTEASISQITTVNENLTQEVQELSRYDRVYEIASKFGLDMVEENVRNVSK